MRINLRVWRQSDRNSPGSFQDFNGVEVSEEMSFLEVLDVINIGLEAKGEEPVCFDSDCREGICGACGAVVNGQAHGPGERSTLCQVHMRSFTDGETITVEPFRARSFPIIKDLMVDRTAFDRIIQAGGFVSVRAGSAPDANALPIGKTTSDKAFDAATCIGCGACVGACPNASAMLFTSAKVAHLGMLPQGQPQRLDRAEDMVSQMDEEGFGGCTNHGECEAACPKGISLEFIARLNRELVKASLTNR